MQIYLARCFSWMLCMETKTEHLAGKTMSIWFPPLDFHVKHQFSTLWFAISLPDSLSQHPNRTRVAHIICVLGVTYTTQFVYTIQWWCFPFSSRRCPTRIMCALSLRPTTCAALNYWRRDANQWLGKTPTFRRTLRKRKSENSTTHNVNTPDDIGSCEENASRARENEDDAQIRLAVPLISQFRLVAIEQLSTRHLLVGFRSGAPSWSSKVGRVFRNRELLSRGCNLRRGAFERSI